VFVPRWWAWSAAGASFYVDTWELRDGPADPGGWQDAAYAGVRSLLTRVGRCRPNSSCDDFEAA
jgi:hypothetical protein